MVSGLSILFTHKNTGLDVLRRMRATSSSSTLMPVRPSTMNTMTSASFTPANACVRMEPWNASSSPISMPPVSMSLNSTPFQSAMWYERSRVTPRISCTMASSAWAMRFTKVDLPTFGRPTTATMGRDISNPFRLVKTTIGRASCAPGRRVPERTQSRYRIPR